MKTGTGEAIAGHSYVFTDTAALVNKIHTEAISGHDTGIITTTPEVAHNAQALHTGVIVIDPTMIHYSNHTKDHQCIETHHTTPETEVTHIHIHPTHS